MEFLKSLFGDEALTYEQFAKAVSEKGYKVADLSSGDYVSKKKYDDESGAKAKTIEELTAQLTARDTDLKALKKQLEDGTKDSDSKVADLTEQLSKLQTEYKDTKHAYEEKLSKQSYEFAVREYAGTQKFSSKAAQKQFISEMLGADLKMQDNNILGADDFTKAYKEANADSFVVETPTEPQPKPMFSTTPTSTATPEANPFDFNFNGVRAH